MRRYVILAVGLLLLLFIGFAFQSDETYSPSIIALQPDEALVMKFSACHSGCTKGTVTFQNNAATVGRHTLNLSAGEVRILDEFFLLADDLDDDYFCSARVMIGFKQTRPFRLPIRKKSRLYPCSFGKSFTPEGLIYHFNERPDEVPFWRLPPEEQILVIED